MPRVQVVFDGVSRGAVAAAGATRAAIRGVGGEAERQTRRLNLFERSIRYGLTRAMYAAGTGVVALGGGIAFLGLRFDDLRQRSQIAFTTMLGSGAKATRFLNQLQAFANKTPFEFQDLVRASQRLLGMGVAARQIIPTMTAVGNAVAGIGGSAAEIDITVRAIGQIQAKGRLMAEEMMQLNEAGTFSWRDLAREIGTSVPKAMDLVQKGAVSSDAFLEAFQRSSQHRFKGMMEQQSHTFGGLLSTIRDMTTQMAGTAMKPLFDLMTRGMEGMVNDNGRLNRRGQEVAHTFGVDLANAVQRIVRFFRDNWGDIVDFLKGTYGAGRDLLDVISKLVGATDKVVSATVGWKNVMKTLIAMKIASVVAGWAGSFLRLAGAEGVGAATTAIGGKTGRGGLIGQLRTLKGIGTITIAIALVQSNDFGGGVRGGIRRKFADLFGARGAGAAAAAAAAGTDITQGPGDKKARSTAAAAVAVAQTQIGIPYQWGGPPILGHSTDCSGLVIAVFRKSGIRISGRTTYDFWRQGRAVNARHLQPADLVFFHMGPRGPEHVGIYIGQGLFIEDPHTGASVRTSTLAGRRDFVGARRYISNILGGTAPAQTGDGGDTGTIDVGTGTGGAGSRKGATKPTIIGVRGQIGAMLRDLPAGLSAAGQAAAKHLRDLRASLHVGMSAADLAKTRVSIQRWGKVLAEEIRKAKDAAAKAAREAADAAARALDRQFSHAQRIVQRDFDRQTQGYIDTFNKETQANVDSMQKGLDGQLKQMRKSFADQMRAFDRETEAGLQRFVVGETPEEAALRTFQAARQAEEDARAMADAAGDPERLRELELQRQERALEEQAQASRQAADRSTSEQQDAYREQRDLQRGALEEAEQDREDAMQTALNVQIAAYQEQRAAQLQAWQDIRDDQQEALQNDLDDWQTWLTAKKRSWVEFLKFLAARGFTVPQGWITDVGNPTVERLFAGAQRALADRLATQRGSGPTGFQAGGRVPGQYVGREDTVVAKVTPGEEIIDRSFAAELRDFMAAGGRSGASYGPIYVLGTTEREVARALASLIEPERQRRVAFSAER